MRDGDRSEDKRLMRADHEANTKRRSDVCVFLSEGFRLLKPEVVWPLLFLAPCNTN
jgi:hypothetical protein